jgi:hypothetical protein
MVNHDTHGPVRKVVQVTLTGPLYERLKLRADRNDRSPSEEIVTLLYLGLTVEDFPDYLERHAHAARREALDAGPLTDQMVLGRFGRRRRTS